MDLAVVDRLMEQYGQSKPSTPMPPKLSDATLKWWDGVEFNLARAAREAIEGFQPGATFTKIDISDFIRQKYPSATFSEVSLSSALSKMRHAGKLKVVKEGAGSEPNVYEASSEAQPSGRPLPPASTVTASPNKGW